MTRLAQLLHDRLVIRLLAAVGGLVLVGQLLIWYPRHAFADPTADGPIDFLVYQRAAARAAQGLSPYWSCAHPRATPPNCLLYPPPFAAVVALAGHVSVRAFQAGTYAILLLAFWAFAAALARLALERPRPPAVLVAAVAVLLTPGLAVTMSFGNLDLVVWALVAWGLADERALPLVVVAAAFKVWPAAPLAALIAARPARLRPALLTTLALLALTLGVLGPSAFVAWRRLAVPGLLAPTLVPGNISLVAWLARAGLDLPPPVLSALPLAAAAAAWWAARRWKPGARAISTGIAAMFVAPICWWYYAPVLLIPIAIRLRRAAWLAPPASPAV